MEEGNISRKEGVGGSSKGELADAIFAPCLSAAPINATHGIADQLFPTLAHRLVGFVTHQAKAFRAITDTGDRFAQLPVCRV